MSGMHRQQLRLPPPDREAALGPSAEAARAALSRYAKGKRSAGMAELQDLHGRAPNHMTCLALAKVRVQQAVDAALKEEDEAQRELQMLTPLHEALSLAVCGVAPHRSVTCLALCRLLMHVLIGKQGSKVRLEMLQPLRSAFRSERELVAGGGTGGGWVDVAAEDVPADRWPLDAHEALKGSLDHQQYVSLICAKFWSTLERFEYQEHLGSMIEGGGVHFIDVENDGFSEFLLLPLDQRMANVAGFPDKLTQPLRLKQLERSRGGRGAAVQKAVARRRQEQQEADAAAARERGRKRLEVDRKRKVAALAERKAQAAKTLEHLLAKVAASAPPAPAPAAAAAGAAALENSSSQAGAAGIAGGQQEQQRRELLALLQQTEVSARQLEGLMQRAGLSQEESTAVRRGMEQAGCHLSVRYELPPYCSSVLLGQQQEGAEGQAATAAAAAGQHQRQQQGSSAAALPSSSCDGDLFLAQLQSLVWRHPDLLAAQAPAVHAAAPTLDDLAPALLKLASQVEPPMPPICDLPEVDSVPVLPLCPGDLSVLGFNSPPVSAAGTAAGQAVPAVPAVPGLLQQLLGPQDADSSHQQQQAPGTLVRTSREDSSSSSSGSSSGGVGSRDGARNSGGSGSGGGSRVLRAMEDEFRGDAGRIGPLTEPPPPLEVHEAWEELEIGYVSHMQRQWTLEALLRPPGGGDFSALAWSTLASGQLLGSQVANLALHQLVLGGELLRLLEQHADAAAAAAAAGAAVGLTAAAAAAAAARQVAPGLRRLAGLWQEAEVEVEELVVELAECPDHASDQLGLLSRIKAAEAAGGDGGGGVRVAIIQGACLLLGQGVHRGLLAATAAAAAAVAASTAGTARAAVEVDDEQQQQQAAAAAAAARYLQAARERLCRTILVALHTLHSGGRLQVGTLRAVCRFIRRSLDGGGEGGDGGATPGINVVAPQAEGVGTGGSPAHAAAAAAKGTIGTSSSPHSEAIDWGADGDGDADADSSSGDCRGEVQRVGSLPLEGLLQLLGFLSMHVRAQYLAPADALRQLQEHLCCVPAERTASGGVRVTEGGLQEVAEEAAALEAYRTDGGGGVGGDSTGARLALTGSDPRQQLLLDGPAAGDDCLDDSSSSSGNGTRSSGTRRAAQRLASFCCGVPQTEAEVAALQRGEEACAAGDAIQGARVTQGQQLAQTLQRLAYVHALLIGVAILGQAAERPGKECVAAAQEAKRQLEEALASGGGLLNTSTRARLSACLYGMAKVVSREGARLLQAAHACMQTWAALQHAMVLYEGDALEAEGKLLMAQMAGLSSSDRAAVDRQLRQVEERLEHLQAKQSLTRVAKVMRDLDFGTLQQALLLVTKMCSSLERPYRGGTEDSAVAEVAVEKLGDLARVLGKAVADMAAPRAVLVAVAEVAAEQAAAVEGRLLYGHCLRSSLRPVAAALCRRLLALKWEEEQAALAAAEGEARRHAALKELLEGGEEGQEDAAAQAKQERQRERKKARKAAKRESKQQQQQPAAGTAAAAAGFACAEALQQREQQQEEGFQQLLLELQQAEVGEQQRQEEEEDPPTPVSHHDPPRQQQEWQQPQPPQQQQQQPGPSLPLHHRQQQGQQQQAAAVRQQIEDVEEGSEGEQEDVFSTPLSSPLSPDRSDHITAASAAAAAPPWAAAANQQRARQRVEQQPAEAAAPPAAAAAAAAVEDQAEDEWKPAPGKRGSRSARAGQQQQQQADAAGVAGRPAAAAPAGADAQQQHQQPQGLRSRQQQQERVVSWAGDWECSCGHLNFPRQHCKRCAVQGPCREYVFEGGCSRGGAPACRYPHPPFDLPPGPPPPARHGRLLSDGRPIISPPQGTTRLHGGGAPPSSTGRRPAQRQQQQQQLQLRQPQAQAGSRGAVSPAAAAAAAAGRSPARSAAPLKPLQAAAPTATEAAAASAAAHPGGHLRGEQGWRAAAAPVASPTAASAAPRQQRQQPPPHLPGGSSPGRQPSDLAPAGPDDDDELAELMGLMGIASLPPAAADQGAAAAEAASGGGGSGRGSAAGQPTGIAEVESAASMPAGGTPAWPAIGESQEDAELAAAIQASLADAAAGAAGSGGGSNGSSSRHAPTPQAASAAATAAAAPATLPAAANDAGLPGLRNETGQYNCFLNVIIQCLWRCADFRRQVSGWDDAFCAADEVVGTLHALFQQFERQEQQRHSSSGGGGSSSLAPVDPEPLREALAALPGQQFKMGEMSDAAEVLLSIYEKVMQACQALGRPSQLNATFGLAVQEEVHCARCSKTTHQSSYTQYFHNTQATMLHMLSLDGGASMGALLREAEAQHAKSCDTDMAGCGAPNPVNHFLGRPPRVFTLQLAWESHTEQPEAIAATLAAIDEEVDLGEVYQGVEAGAHRYRLRSMVCYYGQHYQALVLVPDAGGWLMCDDTRISRVGAWADVRRKCGAGRIQPAVLFYEAMATA